MEQQQSTTVATTAPEHPAVTALRDQLAQVEMTVLTSYTLADAIREGAGVTAQRRNGWVTDGEACALGAGFLAATARGYLTA